MDNDEYLKRAFTFFDMDGDGFIDSDELECTLRDELGPDGLDMISDIIQEVDTDKVLPLKP
jgi:calcium-dependent protein kinase